MPSPAPASRRSRRSSPLPTITNPVLIDGTSQPRYAGTPLIELTGQALVGSDPLSIASSATVRGVMIDGFALGGGATSDVMNVESVPLPAAGGSTESYRFVATTDEELTVVLQAQGGTARLLLLAAGAELMQSDGQSAADGADVISLYVPAGTYSLEVQSLGGAGTYSLTATSSLATSPSQPIAVGNDPSSIIAGDFNGDGHLDLAVANSGDDTVSVLLGNGDGTFQPQVTYAVGAAPVAIVAGDFTGDGHLDLAVANSAADTVSMLLGNGDGTFQPQVTYAVGADPVGIVAGDFTGDGHLDLAVVNKLSERHWHRVGSAGQWRRHLPAPGHLRDRGAGPDAIVAGDFTGDGHLDLAVGNAAATRCRCCWAMATAPSAPGNLRGRVRRRSHRGRGLHRRRPARPGRRQRRRGGTVSVLLGNGDGTFQPQVTYAVGSDPRRSWPGTSPATATSTSPSPTIFQHGVDPAGQWRRHLPAQVTYTVGSDRTRSWRVTSPATATSISPSPTSSTRVVAAGQWRRHLPAAEPTQW